VCVSLFDLFQFKCLAVCNKEDKAAVSFLHMQSNPDLVSSFNEGSRNHFIWKRNKLESVHVQVRITTDWKDNSITETAKNYSTDFFHLQENMSQD
jgi:hypothetical protein